jgi:DNA-binding transcriptional ArsR family regulator
MVSIDELKALVLLKLARRRKWGHSHTSIDNVLKGSPSHLGKHLKEAAEELRKNGLVIAKPTSYGLQISLNPEKSEVIKEMIRRYFGKVV